jgi:hypothetical protein
MMNALSVKVSVPGGVERKRHRQFAEYLDAGNEWFLPSPELMEHINALPSI